MVDGGGLENVADRFEAAARAHPTRTAIRWLDQDLTYRDVARLMNRVAGQVLDAGVSPGDRVALLFDRGATAVWALLGVLRSGAIAVPLLPSHPQARLREILDNCSPRLVLSDAQGAADARALSGRLQVLDLDPGLTSVTREWPEVAGTSAAIILFTSGTSGLPKGVIQTHCNIVWKAECNARAFGATPADRFVFFSTYAVAQGMTTMFSALLTGAALYPFDVRGEGLSSLADWLIAERISVYVSSATLFRTLADSLDGSRRFPALRIMRVGGERVTADDVAAHRRLFGPETRLLNAYSTTESGPVAMHVVERDETFHDGVVPVGHPPDGVTVFLRDDSGNSPLAGAVGEIVVRSRYLSPGYWEDAERTAAVYAPVPGSPELRDYRTGDLGRVRDGLLEHLGRTASRVKIRGFRVELEEVEVVLGRCPDVLRAVALTRLQADGAEILVAYVERRSGCNPTSDTLRAALALTLPEYSIPSVFVILDSLPLTESGKPDRTLLPELPGDRPVLSSAWAAPESALEQAVAEIWREVIGLDRVGVHDAFLSVGGDSLKAMQIGSRLSAAVGVRIPIVELLKRSTIAEIAAVVERYVEGSASASS